VPRLGRDLGVFVPKEEAVEVLAAITTAWAADLKYRVSRVKARLKFMVDDLGAPGMRERVETQLGRTLESFSLDAAASRPGNHLGVQPQREPGLCSIGVPIPLGLVSGGQLIAVADLAEKLGAGIRIARQQNLILVGVRDEDAEKAVEELGKIGFPLDANPVWGNAIACTGEPHCNFSVTETKTRLGRLVEGLEARFGNELADLRLHLDGCPHACAQHWIGDLGFQGTTARDESGSRRQAYDIFVRGGLGAGAAIGKSLFRRVPTEELDAAVAGLVDGWIQGRLPAETFSEFSRRLDDDELGALAGLEPARARQREEVA
jgi:ferredoxin-nitrite reductase